MAEIQPGNILIIDDNESLLAVLQIALSRDGHTVFTANLPSKGLEILQKETVDIVIQDIRMPEMDGVQLLTKIRETKPNQVVFLMTAYSTWDVAVEAMRKGAFGYFEKKSPFDTNELRNKINITLQKIYSEKENSSSFYATSQIIGISAEIREVQKLISLVAPTETPILIYGESGTGKELIAKSLHYSSRRNNNAFITFNCGEFTSTLIESELFGHVKGAFTGAIDNKKGLIELAENGTLFMDELGEMPPDMQVKLLRVLENRELRPVGSAKVKKIDVRFIFATNKNLEEMVNKGLFREDLYYRINVINIKLPTLQERTEDIPLLAGSFLNKYARQGDTKILDQDTMDALKAYAWPGNIRELQNRIQRASILSNHKTLSLQDLFSNEEIENFKKEKAPAKPVDPPTSHQPISQTEAQEIEVDTNIDLSEGFNLEREVEQFEAKYIKAALIKASGNIKEAARILNITIRSIRYKIKKYDINYPDLFE